MSTPAQMTAFTNWAARFAPGFVSAISDPDRPSGHPTTWAARYPATLLIGMRRNPDAGGANRFARFGVQWNVHSVRARRAAPNTRAAGRGAGPEECLPSGPVPSSGRGPRPDGRSILCRPLSRHAARCSLRSNRANRWSWLERRRGGADRSSGRISNIRCRCRCRDGRAPTGSRSSPGGRRAATADRAALRVDFGLGCGSFPFLLRAAPSRHHAQVQRTGQQFNGPRLHRHARRGRTGAWRNSSLR